MDKNLEERLLVVNTAIKQLQKIGPVTEEIKEEMKRLERIAAKLNKKAKSGETAWDKVNLARMMERPRAQFYVKAISTDFMEFHGDRSFADDPAIMGGVAKIGEHVVTIIAQKKGNKAKENIECNFGMPHPEGYRKALRLMKQAEKFKRPIICLIDTPGAYCGLGAEERGQGEAIARNLFEMSQLKTPIIAGVIGEGGSGGALALGVADKVFMQEHAIYSILSPEGFASILWKDASRAKEAADKMKITAQELLEYGIIDDIVLEPKGGAHKDSMAAADALKQYLIAQLDALNTINIDELLQRRYERFRKYGVYNED